MVLPVELVLRYLMYRPYIDSHQSLVHQIASYPEYIRMALGLRAIYFLL